MYSFCVMTVSGDAIQKFDLEKCSLGQWYSHVANSSQCMVITAAWHTAILDDWLVVGDIVDHDCVGPQDH